MLVSYKFIKSCVFSGAMFGGIAFAADITIGVSGPYSGDLASYGIPSKRAAEIVAAKVNAAGGINGKNIKLVFEDDVCKPEVAANVAAKMVTSGVKVVLGHICSGATKAALPTYKDAGVLVISPSATNPALTQSGDYPNFFRTIASDDSQAMTEVDFAIAQGLKKLAVIHDKGDYGKGLAEFAKKFIEESGKAKVVLFEGVTPGAVDYSAIVQKIKRSSADAVIYGGYHPEASKIVSQMKKKRIKIPFISDDGVKDDTFIKIAGKYAEGVYATGPKDNSNNPITKQAVAEHKQKYKEDKGAFFENAYAAMQVLVKAIEATGGEELAVLKKYMQSNDVETSVGKIRFDERGDALGVGFAMYQVQNGKYVEIK